MKPVSHAQPSWLDMPASDFDTAVQPVQLTLAPAPDPVGTPDMFGDQP